MKMLKVIWVVLLFGGLITVVQLVDPPKDSDAARFQRLPDVNLRAVAETEAAAGRPDRALLLVQYVVENNLPDSTAAAELRQKLVLHAAGESSTLSRLRAVGLATLAGSSNPFDTLAGNTVADAALYGEIADMARQGAFDDAGDPLVPALNNIRNMATVFPPAAGAITLVKAGLQAGAINESLTRQFRAMLSLMQTDPKGAPAVEKFKESFMPVFEMAKRCRTWGEFQTIVQQANSSDQVKVLTKMISANPETSRRLAQVLTVATAVGRPQVTACLDHIMRQGPRGIDTLYVALVKGTSGLKFVTENPNVAPQSLYTIRPAKKSFLFAVQDWYKSLRDRHGPIISAGKYLLIAALSGLLILGVVPGRYLEKLIAKPGSAIAIHEPGRIHHVLTALAVGAVLAALAYLLSLAVRPAAEPALLTGVLTEMPGTTPTTKTDSAVLSGTVVLLSLAIHAVVWFFVRSKIRVVEDDEASPAMVRLKRLENLDVFLDLPLFTGLALTVIAFILITLDAGMSRHFAYTSTVVGILSSVSLRIRYLYPLKERLLKSW